MQPGKFFEPGNFKPGNFSKNPKSRVKGQPGTFFQKRKAGYFQAG